MAWVATAILGTGVISSTTARREGSSNRQFQERMSNTAVQRRMEDMKAAGINPILAGKYDATTPPGAIAGAGQAFASGIGSGSSALQAVAEQPLKQAQKVKVEADTFIQKHKAPGAELKGDLNNIVLGALDSVEKATGGIGKAVDKNINQMKGAVTTVVEHAKSIGHDVEETYQTATEYIKDKSESVKRWFQDVWSEMQNNWRKP